MPLYNVKLHVVSSASTDADVCVDRCGCLRRPMRMSAPTDADICADRYEWHNYPL
ncbi:hypothetical protein [Leyella stercorea]|uniref:hypothetical protein n=1 Tax=Leyella stercorea TaxID=363265 RepID=UPI003AB895DE